MLYDAYRTYADAAFPIREIASNSARVLNSQFSLDHLFNPRRFSAALELISLSGFTHSRPAYDIQEITLQNGSVVRVTEDAVISTPFCNLIRFAREDGEDLPKILLAAPMSGHFATLLRGTIRTLLRDFQVHVTDWTNARDIPLTEGKFGFESYTEHIIDFLRAIGPRAHVMAVCQPAVAVLAAASVMAARKDPAQPASIVLMAGPIDPRISPTKVNELATSKPLAWFEDNMIGLVPSAYEGAGRRVYPGFLQLSAFMSMNLDRHAKSFKDLFNARIAGDDAKADQIKAFYEEYFAIMDLDADFYLETVDTVFQRCSLPRGELTFNDEPVTPQAIKQSFLLTIEGERDDICAIGQTLAAQDLCSGLRPYMKSHYMQAGVGHYGVFNGKKWENQIYPVVRDHIQASI